MGNEQDITERFEPLFFPKSVAVIGVPSDEERATLLSTFETMGYGGNLYPINKNADEILGHDVYPSIRDVPEQVDFAIIKLPRTIVPETLRECVDAGVAFVHVLTAGFRESADELGTELETEITEIMSNSETQLIGPNCIGIFSPGGRVPFLDNLLPEPGPIGVVSQSGGLANDIARQGQAHGIRFSKIVTVGNMIDISHTDIIEYFYEDDDTAALLGYIEGVSSADQGRELFELFAAHANEKPTAVLKAGRSEAGARAASSHTGALAGEYEIWQGIFDQTGVIEVDTYEELITIGTALRFWDKPANDSVGVIGHGGGLSVLAVDKAHEVGLDIPPLKPEVVQELREMDIADEIATLENPVDVPAVLAHGNGPDETTRQVAEMVSIVQQDTRLQSNLIFLNIQAIMQGLGGGESFYNAILEGIIKTEKDGPDDLQTGVVLRTNEEVQNFEVFTESRRKLVDEGIPVFNSLDNALDAIAALRSFEGDYQAPGNT